VVEITVVVVDAAVVVVVEITVVVVDPSVVVVVEVVVSTYFWAQPKLKSKKQDTRDKIQSDKET